MFIFRYQDHNMSRKMSKLEIPVKPMFTLQSHDCQEN